MHMGKKKLPECTNRFFFICTFTASPATTWFIRFQLFFIMTDQLTINHHMPVSECCLRSITCFYCDTVQMDKSGEWKFVSFSFLTNHVFPLSLSPTITRNTLLCNNVEETMLKFLLNDFQFHCATWALTSWLVKHLTQAQIWSVCNQPRWSSLETSWMV